MGISKTALVLGGGFAGLSAAIHLACHDYEVTLLEQAQTLGGKAAEFRRDGFRFDTGPSVFTLQGVIKDIFDLAGRDLPFELEPLDLLCRYLFPSGRVWDVFQDRRKTMAQLMANEVKVYRKALLEAKKLYESSASTFIFGKPPSLADLATYGLRSGLQAHPLKTLPQLLEGLGADGELKQFFLRFATYFGADPYQAPAILHNICWVELGLGLAYPKGGIYRLVTELERLARDLGVQIQTGVTVKALELEGDTVKQVKTTSGDVAADNIISSLDIIRTHKLLGLKTDLQKQEPSLSGFVGLFGYKGESELKHHNISFSSDYEAEFAAIKRGEVATDPTLYINISSKTDASDAPPGYENWFVMANAPALDSTENQWSLEDEDRYAEQLMVTLEKRGLAQKHELELKQIIGPNKLARFAHRGSIYGTASHSLLKTLRPPQQIKGVSNLTLAGGTVFPGGGIPLALLSGKSAAELIIEHAKQVLK